MSNHQNANPAGSSAAYDNVAMAEGTKGPPTVMNMEPPPPYPGPMSQMAYPGSPISGGGAYPGGYPEPPTNIAQCPGYPGPPTNGGGPYPPYPAGPVMSNVVLQTATGPRYACGHCQGQFVYHRQQGLAPCPFCHRFSAVGNFVRNRGITFIIVGIIFLLLGIGVTVGTMLADANWYFVWFGGILVGIIFIIRGAILLATIKTARPIAQTAMMTSG